MQSLKLERGIYSKEVLLKTAYSFTDKVYIHLSCEDQYWIVDWETKEGCSIMPQEFENELIQQQTRLMLEQRTAEVRKMMIARALASTIIDTADITDFSEEAPEKEEEEMILKGWHKTNDSV